MPITYLSFNRTKVSDLSPLATTRLGQIHCLETKISNLSPLSNLPLTILYCPGTNISDLSPLEHCKKLASLDVQRCKVTAASVAALQEALPNCKIEWDDPAKATTPQPAATSKLFLHDPAFPQWMKDV